MVLIYIIAMCICMFWTMSYLVSSPEAVGSGRSPDHTRSSWTSGLPTSKYVRHKKEETYKYAFIFLFVKPDILHLVISYIHTSQTEKNVIFCLTYDTLLHKYWTLRCINRPSVAVKEYLPTDAENFGTWEQYRLYLFVFMYYWSTQSFTPHKYYNSFFPSWYIV